MVKDINYYRLKFSPKSKSNKEGLNVSRSAGVAPNKPILLLSVIELIERSHITNNRIYLSPELIATFFKFWHELEIERKPDIGMPFFHLKHDGFWHFKSNLGHEYIESFQSKVRVRTVNGLNQAVQYAYLDPELFYLLKNPASRNELTLTLIDSWFSNKTEQLQRSLSINAFANISDELLVEGGKVYKQEEVEKADSQTAIVRDGAFRRIVTSTYGYRCAFCGLQVFNNQDNIVDGAHIKPFSQFYDDRINNGLSLCKNHHWAFDRFWFTINNDYTILVSDNIHEDSPNATLMKNFNGRQILLPNRSEHHPRIDAIAWHRQTFLEKIA